MKLLAVTQEFAGKPMIRLQWNKEGFFFADPQPAVPMMIAIDAPGLRSTGAVALREWLVEYHKNAGRRGEHSELVEGVWRKAVLEDLLDATNPNDVAWHLSRYFTLDELTEFASKHAPALHGEVKVALTLVRDKQGAALRKLEKSAARIMPAVNAGIQRISEDATELEMTADRAKVAQLGAFEVERWIETAASLKHDAVKRELLAAIGKQLVATGGDIGAALGLMIEHKLDRVFAPDLWKAIANHVVLEPNIVGETIDLTKAREMTVALGWDAWRAGRVGRVKLARSALVVTVENRVIYVRGERKLLHAIRSRGGSISRFGCTLVVGGKSADSAHAKLLEVDRIDSLAQVDPRGAARLAGELPAGDPIATALGHALGEPRWRRILADLLIERLVGIDADVARRLARASGRANRR